MATYKPEMIKGKPTGTGWPIDGHVLHFTRWDYDPENYHLYGWDDTEDEAVMETVWITENEAGLSAYDSKEEFVKAWKAKKWEPDGVFALPLHKVEVIEVYQNEEKDTEREKLKAAGIDLRPRHKNERGGILCLPLDRNLRRFGSVREKHPDWEAMACPACGAKCWKSPEAQRLHEEDGVQFLCTECAIKAGLATPYPGTANKPNPEGNRATRRAKHGKKTRH